MIWFQFNIFFNEFNRQQPVHDGIENVSHCLNLVQRWTFNAAAAIDRWAENVAHELGVQSTSLSDGFTMENMHVDAVVVNLLSFFHACLFPNERKNESSELIYHSRGN